MAAIEPNGSDYLVVGEGAVLVACAHGRPSRSDDGPAAGGVNTMVALRAE
jgi:hypothetical protein